MQAAIVNIDSLKPKNLKDPIRWVIINKIVSNKSK